MLVTEMSRPECEELVARISFGQLACAHDNQPYVVPTYFASEPGHLYGFATMGQKIEWMRLNPLVCVAFNDVRNQSDWMSVVVTGRYEEFPDTPQHSKQRQRAQSVLEKMTSLWWEAAVAAGQIRQRFDRSITIFYCIHIEEISGRRALQDPVQHV